MVPANNIGIGHFGIGDIRVKGPAIGQIVNDAPDRRDEAPRRRADVGILTVIEPEMTAVIKVLRSLDHYNTRRLRNNGPLVHEANLRAGVQVRLAALQTLDRGPRAALVAFQSLVREYQPAVVLLVGVAGAVSHKVRIGDVVVADQVIYYDARREAPDGPHRRGQDHVIAAPVGHRLNEFFADTSGDAVAPDGTPFRMFRGPIGSGDAVITDVNSEIRRWLHEYHEKVLAVETEAAGVAHAFHEQLGDHHAALGWLTIRGISDAADSAKDHDYHVLASEHAAAAMRLLLPYLYFSVDQR